MKRAIGSLFARLRDDQRGAVAILVAGSMIGLLGVTGMAVDIGMVMDSQTRLQASADAAALAGAQDINQGSGGTATTTATTYSGVSGKKNASSSLQVTMASGYPVLRCLTSTGVSCNGPDSANAILVKEQATVPTYFARIFGLQSWNISASALAGARGGGNGPADVVIVLDTTQSMNTTDSSCAIANSTRLDCALAGVRTLLAALSPCGATLGSCGTATSGNVNNPVDRVSLMVFPGLSSSTQAQYEYDCSSTQPAIAKYSASPVYQVLGFQSDYRSSDGASSLTSSSNLVRAARGGGSGCAQGLQAVGGVGTYYADAITAAQTALAASTRTTAQKIIIMLGDGDANASSSNISSSKVNNQCHQAITAAQAATTAGTIVYTIAYGASTSSTGSCSTDTTRISACSTLQQMASSSSTFFSDNVGGTSSCASSANPISDLSSIFSQIGTNASRPRLLSLSTQ